MRTLILSPLIGLVLLITSVSGVAHAAGLPPLIPMQGMLQTGSGAPVADGKYSVTIRVYDSVTATDDLWKEIHVAVKVTSGFFSTNLGEVDPKVPLPVELFTSAKALFIGLQVSDDPELPRVAFASVPYALLSKFAETAQSAKTADSAALADLAKVAEGLTKPITGDLIAPGTLSASSIGFTYAGSNTKGGPALDLQCTGCVSLDEIAPGVLTAANTTYDGSGVGATAQNAQDMFDALWPLVQLLAGAVHVSGQGVGIGKDPAAGCGLDIAGLTCVNGLSVLYTMNADSADAMNQVKTIGQLVYRTDVQRAFMLTPLGFRKVLFEALCGDGLAEALEECDDGKNNADAPDKCRLTCKKPACGDKIADSAEQCDDGNDINTDGCVAGCKTAKCGDGYVYTGVEECDDGNNNANTADKCRTTCNKPICGDGITDTGEQCDDGNSTDNDGCSNTCKAPFSQACATKEAENPCFTTVARDVALCGNTYNTGNVASACATGWGVCTLSQWNARYPKGQKPGGTLSSWGATQANRMSNTWVAGAPSNGNTWNMSTSGCDSGYNPWNSGKYLYNDAKSAILTGNGGCCSWDSSFSSTSQTSGLAVYCCRN